MTITENSESESPQDVEPSFSRSLVLGVVGLIALILVWLLIRLLTSDWLAIGDYRTLQLRVADVFGPHTPSIGVYSRFQWNHPGPLIFVTLAAPYRLLGSSDVSLLIGALIVNLATIATAMWIAIRAGRRVAALTGLFIVLLIIGMNPAGLADPWNPRFMVLSIFTCGLAAWRTVFGDRPAAIALVVWGSFAVQCHLGSALPIATLVIIATTALVVRSIRGADRRHDRITLAQITGIALVLWSMPIVEQFTSDDGNIGQIFSFLQDPPATTTGFATGTQIVFRFLSIPGDWVRGLEPIHPNVAFDTGGWAIPWAMIALGVAAWWAWRRRWMPELTACLIGFALVAVSIVATSRIVGAPAPYLVRWIWAIAAYTWMAAALVGLRQLCLTRFGARRGLDLVLGLTLLGLVVMIPRGIDLAPLRLSESWRRTISTVAPEVIAAIEDIDGTIWVNNGLGVDGSTALEVISRSEGLGLDVRRDSEWTYIVGDHRTVDRLSADRELVFITGDMHEEFDANPDYVKVAEFDPRTAEQRSAMQAIVDRHTAEIDVIGLDSKQAREARAAAFSEWALTEVQLARPSQDFLDYWRLVQEGDLLTVYLSVGRPRAVALESPDGATTTIASS